MAPRKAFQGNCSREKFDAALARSAGSGGIGIDADLADQFREALDHHMAAERANGHKTWRERFDELCEMFRHVRSGAPADACYVRARLIVNVRMLLAATCLRALKLDLIILDEFQRFRDLISDQSDLGSLASDLFEHEEVQVLLLSATPYKMYTLAAEAADDNHYAEFVRTLKFLQPVEAENAFEGLLDDFRREGISHADGTTLSTTPVRSPLVASTVAVTTPHAPQSDEAKPCPATRKSSGQGRPFGRWLRKLRSRPPARAVARDALAFLEIALQRFSLRSRRGPP